jgi:hypothetical protein
MALGDVGLALRMCLDEENHFPETWGHGVTGFNEAYGVLVMSDWKEALIP